MPVPKPVPVSAGTDADLVARAVRKVMSREELTKAERAALKRHEKGKEERLRWSYYQSIPQKHWRQMSGRQTKILQEQAQRYGLPFGGPTIDLGAVVRGLHDFLAENAVKLARADEADLWPGAGNSPALERYREERAQLARLDRLEREGSLLPREEGKQALGRIAAILRTAGEHLQRRFGSEAAEVLSEALDEAQRDIDRMFAEPVDASDAP